jgi:hypothetical protein
LCQIHSDLGIGMRASYTATNKKIPSSTPGTKESSAVPPELRSNRSNVT